MSSLLHKYCRLPLRRVTRRRTLHNKDGTSRIRLFSSMDRSDELSENSGRPFNSAASFHVTDPPNPNWQLRQGLPDHVEPGKSWRAEEEKGWKTWNLSDISPRYATSCSAVQALIVLLKPNLIVRISLTRTADREVYPLLTSCIVPRPIALVSSTSSHGISNLAPFRGVFSAHF
jgi:hypothetical protein